MSLPAVTDFVHAMSRTGPVHHCSVPDGMSTVYGTCYGMLALEYLGVGYGGARDMAEAVGAHQDPATGWFIGPELADYDPPPEVKHSREHLLMHSTSAALPVLQQFDVPARHPLRAAHAFCDPRYMTHWLDERDLANPWFEGNNILFAGQFLVYLRDVEKYPGAQDGLNAWFDWLDRNADPNTGLWGTNHGATAHAAAFGGYHQLLVYYHEKHPVPAPKALVDTVLGLQHPDGGFSPGGGGGACEDVDCVDILVNMYKQMNYRRAEIRHALRRCKRLILSIQNPDGGFPYKRNVPQSHMGIPGTQAPPNVSCMFPTWFRVHTLALIAEILTDDANLRDVPFRFNKALSMGWHEPWDKPAHPVTAADRAAEAWVSVRRFPANIQRYALRGARKIKRNIRAMISPQ